MISYKGLEKELKKKGISKTELSQELGISSRTIAKIAKGERLSKRTILKIAETPKRASIIEGFLNGEMREAGL